MRAGGGVSPPVDGRGLDRVQGGEDGFTGRGAVGEVQLLQGVNGRLVLRGRRHQQVRRAGETRRVPRLMPGVS